ncbi:MAG: multicopper oxidase domain-containing protein [Anaerolineae bacterium]|nr:multicopper oxidase domain-containing protein [Anaerolineae bacterium]
MITRRQFLKYTAVGTAGLLFPWGGAGSAASRVYAQTPKLKKFIDPLITPIPVLTPGTNPSYPGADYYEISMEEGTTHKFHSQLGPAKTWYYAPMPVPYLGPTIEATYGKHVVVKYINNLPSGAGNHPLNSAIDKSIGNGMYIDLPDGRAVPHLHGGFTEPHSDGHPDAWFTKDGQPGPHYHTKPGSAAGQAIFEYSNEQPAAQLWYHDHAMGITRLNVYAGLAGLYFVRDATSGLDTGDETNQLGLPYGDYEIPLVIQDKTFNPDGSLFYPIVGVTQKHLIWVPEFFGDTPVINGVAYPFLNVEPRRYRFRMLNGSQARFYSMQMVGSNGRNLPFTVIGMEQSLLPAPVQLTKLVLGPGERADVIVDFTGVKLGTSYTLTNNAKTPYPGGGKRAGANMPQLMKFNVNVPLNTAIPNKAVPRTLFTVPNLPTQAQATKTRQIIMKETMDPVAMAPLHVRLNELWFDGKDDKNQHYEITETVAEKSTEIWEFINLTVDAHPMHMHLVQFQVLNRQAFNAALFTTDYMNWVGATRTPTNLCGEPNINATLNGAPVYLKGAPIPPAPEETGLKDTVKALPGQVTRVLVKFEVPEGTPLPAEYVYHCHILEHEENEMMRPFVVTSTDGPVCPAANASAPNGPIAPQFVPPPTTPVP